MRKIFQQELAALGDDLVAMSSKVAEAISGAGNALLNADTELAQQIISADREIDALERDLDERCVELLARQQPVATDLRIIVSCLRMSTTLERMGDLARHIAEVARLRYPEKAIPEQVNLIFSRMNEAANRVARQVTSLLQNHDLDLAAAVESDDDQLDALHQDSFTAMLSGDWQANPQQAVDVTLVARYFERFGDHGVSIARRVTYLVTGDFDS